ncbi:MAG: WYL domain-containing protein [Microbacterium sp.]|nr:WYL domain-containing protein [Microbacterium sp.]
MSSTTTRLLELLSLLQTTREWPGPELASRLGISDRTVRRDIDRLRDMGYNIRATHGSDGGYRLQAGSELPPLLFDEDQALAVGIALQTVVGVGVRDAAERALLTIRQVMPSRLRHRLDAVDVVSIASRPGAASPHTVSPDVLVALSTAISFSEVLRFDYASREGSERDDPTRPARRVEPHRIVTSHGNWYLLAWDLDRDDWRLFSADRITPRVPTGPRFTPRTVPGGDVEEFVAARFKGSDTNEWPCRGSVILDLPLREVLPFVGDGQAEALDDDRCILTAGSWSWGSLAAAFGRFEVQIEVIEPTELRDAFATLAQRYALTATGGGEVTAAP